MISQSIIASVIGCVFLVITSLPLESIRSDYPYAAENKSACNNWLTKLERQNNKTNVELAYLGAFQIMWANHLSNPFDKLATFKKGKANIEKAVQQQPENIEIRFIRYSIQKKCPKFLNYQNNLSTDKSFLTQHKQQVEQKSLNHLIESILKD